jgi:hypothetical protein
METAAPLKSEIGDGRRRLLFRDAVAAMPLFPFFFKKIQNQASIQTRERRMGLCLLRMDG